MIPAPAHLETKLRFGDLTIGQIAAVLVGVLFAFFWAQYLSPFHGTAAAVSGAYLGGLPVAAVYVASQTEFDLWTFALAAASWRQREGRYLPGGGDRTTGYTLLGDADSDANTSGISQLDLAALWREQ